MWCGPNFVNLKRGSQELGAYPYDAILPRLKHELDELIASREVATPERLAGLGDLRRLDLPADTLAVRAAQIAEASRELVGGLIVDEGTPPLPPREQALGFHHVERLAHGAGADPELARQVALVGNG